VTDTDRVIQSPILVGRDDLLSLSQRRLAEAAAGHGQLLFVAGEAGIGKTRLIGAIATQAHSGYEVVRAAAFPGDGQSSAGLLLDLATDLRTAGDPALIDLGRRLSARVRGMPGEAGDAHRRRRLLIQDLVELLIEARPGRPVLMVLEDLHWADELSLEVLGHLAGRIRERPFLIACSYRSDELYPGLPMRKLRTRLLAQRLAEEVRLARLGLAETATMASALLGRSAPAQLVAAIHARSDGIPLHVEELLAAGNEEVPDTLSDAILSRAQRLSPRTREVVVAAAVLGRSFDFDLLTAVTDIGEGEVAIALRELREAYLVLPGTEAHTFDFRHALIRDAIYADTDLPTRRRLHERVALVARERGYRDAFLSAHFEQAMRDDLAHAHAMLAAGEASAMSAHGEALELYRRAVRCAPETLAALDRASLMAALGDESAASDDNKAAAEAYRASYDLAMAAGDRRAAAALVPRMVAVGHLLGDGLTTRVGALQAALDGIAEVPGADHERARLMAALAAAYMLDRRLDEAIDYGEQSLAESRRLADDESSLNTAATHGSVLVFAGRMDEGWALLEASIARARATHQESEAARGYRMLGSSASVLVEYDRAQSWLSDGMRYAESVELWNHRHYMAAHLAHVQWATGRWSLATDTAQHALADGRGGITTRITAEYVLGYLAMGRGDWKTATELLEEAYAQGEAMAELQRLSPPLWGLAECARCQGDNDAAISLCEKGFETSAKVTDAAYLFPYLVTGVRAHLAHGAIAAAQSWLDRAAEVLVARGIPGTMPSIAHGKGLLLLARGDLPAAQAALESAARSWQARGRFWEGAWARLDLAQLAQKARRRAEAVRLLSGVRADAVAAGATVLEDAAGINGERAEEPWFPLSAREFEVAQLVAEGLTNRQIAERLVLAPKTVSAHIEHILTKLSAARRTEIASWCAGLPRG
jgi:DNA-binding CsgD family transcriptional regulator/tetratricopeptide (TPR) repeat protein